MGMYDDVRVHSSHLPDRQDIEPRIISGFQSKGFGCNLDTITIEEDGTVWRKNKWEEIEKEQITDLHQRIRFYDGDREYIATFTHGKLEGVKQIHE